MSDQQKTIPNHRITNFKSFEDVTAEPRQIAGLYFYQMLDCLVDLAWKDSADFRRRPQLYRRLGASDAQEGGRSAIALLLARLNAQYGTQIDVLSKAQRNAIYLPIFGSDAWLPAVSPQSIMPITPESDSFSRLRDSLLRAATAFAERPVQSLVNMLRENVVQAHRPFKDYLLYLHGDSVRFSEQVLENLTERICYPILRADGVADVFGISGFRTEASEYPYATDPAADALVEEMSRQLQWVDNSQILITREHISNLQRVALRGAEAIATVIDFEEPKATEEDLELLITKCYTWGTALSSVNGQQRAARSRALPSGTASTVPPQPRAPQSTGLSAPSTSAVIAQPAQGRSGLPAGSSRYASQH